MDTCWKCGVRLSADEMGLNYKMINRGVEKFLCLSCLSAAFRTPAAKLLELAEHFRAAGCAMFPPRRKEGMESHV